ncbi:FxLD family lanthipeptide [Sphaerisporangium sp. NPDC051017]
MEPTDFNLDVRLVAAGPVVPRAATEDCTSDNCGDTPGSAGIANC